MLGSHSGFTKRGGKIKGVIMKYQISEIEPNFESVMAKYGSYEHYRKMHPEYHLYQDLQKKLPEYVRMLNKLKNIKFPENLNGDLPF